MHDTRYRPRLACEAEGGGETALPGAETGEIPVDRERPVDGSTSVGDEPSARKLLARREQAICDAQHVLIRVALLLVVLWLLFFVCIGVMKAPNADMSPGIGAGDLVLFYRLDRDVRAHDVVAVRKETPESDGRDALTVSRVVAVAGDTVSIDSGHLVVNGVPQTETDIFFDTEEYEGMGTGEVTLGEGQCYVLGDRRMGAMDSRAFGPVDSDEIVGTVITVLRRNNL